MTTTPTPAGDPSPASMPPVVVRPAPADSGGTMKKLPGFLWWLVTGFGLLTAIRRRGRSHSEEIVAYSVPESFFLWAIILTGFIGAPWVRHAFSHNPASTAPVLWGWIYAWVLLYTMVTVLFDLSTPKFLLWAGIFSFVWLASRYLQDVKQIPALAHVIGYLRGLHPKLDPGFATVISWLLLPAWVGSLFHTFTRGRKVFSPNSIEERYVGEGTEVIDRSGLKFRSHYPDVFATLIGLGCGDLEAVDGNGKVVKKWGNILFLAFIWNKLDEVLHQRAAVVDNATDEPVEVEEVRKGR